jgi:cytochrome c6
LVSQQSKIKDLTSKNESLAAGKAEVTRERNTTRHALDAAQQELGGAAVFAAMCTPCHFRDGGGGIGPHLFGGAVVADLSEAQEVAKVTNGGMRMPAFGGRLTPKQIQQVVEYTRTH